MENFEQLSCKCIEIVPEVKFTIVACCVDHNFCCIATDTKVIGVFKRDTLEFDWHTALRSIFYYDIVHLAYLREFDLISVACNQVLIVYDYINQTIKVEEDFEEIIWAFSWNPMRTRLIIIDLNRLMKLYEFSGTQLTLMKSVVLEAPKERHGNHIPNFKTIDEPSEISWRGDGSEFVINYKSMHDGNRYIKLYDENLNCIKTKPIGGLEVPVAFQKGGSYFAASSSVGNCYNLLLLDSSCEVRLTLPLLHTHGSVKKLIFNPKNNDLLAIQHDDSDLTNYIDIYVRYLDKWTMKQRISYSRKIGLQGFDWDTSQDHPLYALVTITDDAFTYHTFRLSFNRCLNQATIGVVNGGFLILMKFNNEIIAPPYGSTTMQHIRPINRVLFHPTQPFCIIIDSQMYFIVIDYQDLTSTDVKLRNNDNLSRFHHVDWKESGADIYLVYKEQPPETVEIHGAILTFYYMEFSFAQNILPVEVTDCSSTTYELFARYIEYVYVQKWIPNDYVFEFAICINRNLYINNEQICTGVLSLCTHLNYVLFTHESGNLYCLRADQVSEFVKRKQLHSLPSTPVSKGVKILTITWGVVPLVILVTPISSLETVTTKLITIDRIVKIIEINNWMLAFDIARKYKIDPNVLIDADPQNFIKNVDDVIKAHRPDVTQFVDFMHGINLNWNIFDRAPKFWPHLPITQSFSKETVLDALLAALTNGMQDQFTITALTIITMKRKSVKDALEFVRNSYNKSQKLFYGTIITRMMKLVDPKTVIRSAYLLMDIDFLEFVYAHSIVDPAYYNQIIENLKDQAESQRKFIMSCDGGDMAAAVRYKLQCENVTDEEVKDFITKHSVERAAYHSINSDHPRFTLISELFARYLSKRKQHSCAGNILQRAQLYQSAMLEYILADDYYEINSMLDKLDQTAKSQVIDQMVFHLVQSKKIDEAVAILERHGQGMHAINILRQEKLFKKAMALARRDHPFYKESLLQDIKEYITSLEAKIADMDRTILNSVRRLQEIRRERQTKALQSMSSLTYLEDLEVNSVSSVLSYGSTASSSGGSTMSRHTRKNERRKRDTRPGSKFEDIALIRELYDLFSSITVLGETIVDLCLIPEIDQAIVKDIYNQCVALQTKMSEVSHKIWPEVLATGEITDEVIDSAIIKNREHLDEKFRRPPTDIHNSTWHIELF